MWFPWGTTDSGGQMSSGEGARQRRPAASGFGPRTSSSLEDEASDRLYVRDHRTVQGRGPYTWTISSRRRRDRAMASLWPNDRLMCVLPIHHVNGICRHARHPLLLQRQHGPESEIQNAVPFGGRLHEEHVTCVSVVPTLLEFLLDADEDLSSYRLDRLKDLSVARDRY